MSGPLGPWLWSRRRGAVSWRRQRGPCCANLTFYKRQVEERSSFGSQSNDRHANAAQADGLVLPSPPCRTLHGRERADCSAVPRMSNSSRFQENNAVLYSRNGSDHHITQCSAAPPTPLGYATPLSSAQRQQPCSGSGSAQLLLLRSADVACEVLHVPGEPIFVR